MSATPAATPTADVTVVAAGLVHPRGFVFGADGALLVASAGGADTAAGVARIDQGCAAPLVDGFPHYRIVFGAETGVSDVDTLGGEVYFVLAGGNTDGSRATMPNGLYRLDPALGATALVADISAFIRDNPVSERPRDYDTDGQPYRLLAMADDAFWVTEGNSNQVLRLGLDGAVSRVADLSAGHPIPTGIAPAPDGGAYVAYMTPIPYPEGGATVVTVAPDGTVTEVWRGLTLVTDLAVGPDGALYALEMATGYGDDPGAIGPGSGRVVRMTGPESATPVVTGLSLPIAMEFGPDGALYIAGPSFGADAGEGTILRVALPADPSAAPVAVPADLAAPACPPAAARVIKRSAYRTPGIDFTGFDRAYREPGFGPARRCRAGLAG